jgi:hypothetical protein
LNLNTRQWALVAAVIVLVIASVSFYMRAGTMLHPEGDAYLVDHLSDRPYLSKILCPHLIDSTDYMARPVSHFFENIDAHLFHLFYSLGFPIFLSISTMVMLIILSAIIWFCAINYAKTPPSIATLMLALLWTSPNIFFAGGLYRDAKIAAAFFFLLAGLYAFRMISQDHAFRFRDFTILFILALLACLSDPQGFAFVAILSSIALVWAFFTKSRTACLSFASGCCAALTYLVLSIFVLPRLVAKYTWFHTYNAFSHYQQTHVVKYLSQYLWNGLLLHLDTLRLLFGDISRVEVAIVLVLFCIAIFIFTSRRWLVGGCFILFLLENFLMDGAMIARHSALMLPEVIRGGYYQLPSVLLFFTATLFLMSAVLKSSRLVKITVTALLMIAIVSNISALPRDFKLLTKSRMAYGYVVAGPYIRAQLVSLSKIAPAGPPLPYDAIGASDSVVVLSLYNPEISTQKNIEFYIRMSRIISFLRSEKGLPYDQNWQFNKQMWQKLYIMH